MFHFGTLEVRLGAVSGVDTGTRGTTYFDAFESRRSSYIGQQGGLRGFELGKSMRKAGLAKMIAAGGDHSGLALVGEGELTDYLFAGQHFDSYINLCWVEVAGSSVRTVDSGG